MLGSFLVIGTSVFIIGLLVGLETALSHTRRAFIPEVKSVPQAAQSSQRHPIPFSDFVAASRLFTAIILLLAGVALGRFWALGLTSLTSSDAMSGIVTYSVSVVATVFVVSALLLFCYSLPSDLATRFPDTAITICAPFGRFITRIMWPLLLITKLVGGIASRHKDATKAVEEEALETDIRCLVEEGERAGVIEEEEREIISRVFKLGDKQIVAIMTPYRDVVFLRTSMTSEKALEVVLDARFTWYPLVDGEEQEVIGVVSAHDVFQIHKQATPGASSLRGIVSKVLDVPDSLTALELLERFKAEGGRLAVVRDEYGRISGIATVDDVLQAIVGDLGTVDGEERSIVTREDGSLLVDASSDIGNLFELLGCSETTSDQEAPFHSVGGFVMTSLGHIPKVGEIFFYDGFRFEVVDMDGKRIDKVLVARVGSKSAVGA